MGYPCLVAGDHVVVAIPDRAGAQRAQIGTGIGFGKNGGGQNLTGGDFRQPVFLLLLRAAAEDEFGGDFGAGAE